MSHLDESKHESPQNQQADAAPEKAYALPVSEEPEGQHQKRGQDKNKKRREKHKQKQRKNLKRQKKEEAQRRQAAKALEELEEKEEGSDEYLSSREALLRADRYAHQKSYKQAVSYYQLAIDKYDYFDMRFIQLSALYHLGLCYEHGLGVPKDECEARGFYQRAADPIIGSVAAQYALGRCYYNGIGGPVDDEKAFAYFMKAIEEVSEGVEKNWLLIGNLEDKAVLVPGQQPTTYKELLASLCYSLAECYQHAKGVAQNEREAFKYYGLTFTHGCLESKPMLETYADRVALDPTKAAKLHRAMAVTGGDRAAAVLRLVEEDEHIIPFKGSPFTSSELADFEVGPLTRWHDWPKWLLRQLKRRSPAQLRDLGDLYVSGDGVEKNHLKAAQLYKLAADQGDAQAQYRLGICYEKSIYFVESRELLKEKNWSKVIKSWELAANQGSVEAAFALGRFYHNEMPKVLEKMAIFNKNTDFPAHQWFTRAVELGVPGEAKGEANNSNDGGLPGQVNSQTALAESHYYLGVFHEQGTVSLDWDLMKAEHHYRLAAELGSERAAHRLHEFGLSPAELIAQGHKYMHGNGEIDNKLRAVLLYELAAKKGDAKGQYLFGLCCEHGIGVSRSPKAARGYYALAAKQGCIEAMYALGESYFRSAGFEHDFESAQFCFERVVEMAREGVKDSKRDYENLLPSQVTPKEAFAKSHCVLGYFHVAEIAREKDKERAFFHYSLAATLGSDKAVSSLKNMYEVGVGVVQDKWKAEILKQCIKPVQTREPSAAKTETLEVIAGLLDVEMRLAAISASSSFSSSCSSSSSSSSSLSSSAPSHPVVPYVGGVSSSASSSRLQALRRNSVLEEAKRASNNSNEAGASSPMQQSESRNPHS